MRGVLIVVFVLVLGLAWMVVDIKITSHKQSVLEDFASLSRLYTLQIEKDDFVYRKKNE